MKLLFAIALFIPALALAQQQRPSDEELNAMFATLAEQRNASQNQVAQLAAKMATLEKQLKEALGREAALRPAIGAEKPETKSEKAK